ncbi:MAG: DUF2125 domain-containing protein [Rhodospirillaceae bacterium]
MIKRLAALVVVLALLYGAAWLGAAFWLRRSVDTIVADLVSQGYAIERGAPSFVGFPARVGIAFPHTSVRAPAARGAWRWGADRVAVTLSAAAPTEPVIDLSGAHRITGFASAPEGGLSVVVGRGRASLAFGADGSLENIVLKLSETRVGTSETPALFGFKDSSLHIALNTGHVTLWVREVSLAHEIAILGETISALDLALDVTGVLPSGPLRESLAAWRDNGGAIELRSFTLDWPPAHASGNATLALDSALQPLFAATVKFRGFFDIVAALAAAGHVREREASLAKVVLGMLARPSAAGEPELSLPLTVQNRKLTAGPVPLMEIPAVVWDETARVP